MDSSSNTDKTSSAAAPADAAQSAGSGDAAARAYAELAEVLGEIEAGYIGPDRGMFSAEERAAGRNLIANALQHGFQCWYDIDPKRPLFHRWLSSTKKLLGDNPDAVYYGTDRGSSRYLPDSRQRPRRLLHVVQRRDRCLRRAISRRA